MNKTKLIGLLLLLAVLIPTASAACPEPEPVPVMRTRYRHTWLRFFYDGFQWRLNQNTVTSYDGEYTVITYVTPFIV